MKDQKIFDDNISTEGAKSYKRQSWSDLPIPKCVMCGVVLAKIEGWNLFQCDNGCLDYVGKTLTFTDYRDARFGINDFLYAH